MKQIHSSRLIVILLLIATVTLAVFAAFFIRLEISRRSANIEYQVFRIMTGIVEVWNADGSFDPDNWPDVSGFGIYSPEGVSVYRYGTAPEYLDRRDSVVARGLSSLSGSSMTFVRRLGSIPMMEGMGPGMARINSPGSGGRMNGGSRMMTPMAGGMMMDGNGPGEGPGGRGRYAFIEIDVAPLLREGRLVVASVLVALVFFFAILSLVVVFARKLQEYRIREKDSAYLVQLGAAARTLAHEIKNPLGIIRVQCATLRRTVPDDRIGNIGIIEEETARLVKLTDRIRDFLHTSAGTPNACGAASILDRLRERYDGRLSVAAPDEAPPDATVFIDPDRLTQILDNLIVNALDAAEGTGTVPELSLAVHRNSVLFAVSDDGRGVDPADRERLFEPFFTTKARGSGIGLALARRFAEQAGGTIEYAPRSVKGSVFTLVLPKGEMKK